MSKRINPDHDVRRMLQIIMPWCSEGCQRDLRKIDQTVKKMLAALKHVRNEASTDYPLGFDMDIVDSAIAAAEGRTP